MQGIEKIIRKAAQGSRKALRQLFDAYYTLVYRTVFRYVGDHHTTEDLVSITFHKAFRNLERFTYEDTGSFAKWIRRIAINESLRESKNDVTLVFPDLLQPDVYESEEEGNYEMQDVKTILDSLPSGYRTIMLLHYMDGLTHEEIADYLGISKNTSKSQLLKAKNFLRKKHHHEER